MNVRNMVFLSAAMLWNVPLASAEPVTLVLKFPPGQVDRMTMNMEIDQSFTSDQLPAPVRQTMTQTVDFTFRVAEVKATGARVELTYHRVRASTNISGQQMTFDSSKDKEGDNPLASTFSAIVGSKVELHFDAKGKLEKVTGMNELLDKLEQKSGGKAVAAQLRQAFNDEQLKQMMAQALTDFLPKKPVSPNDTWTMDSSMSLAGIGDLKLKMNMRLASVEIRNGHQHAKIEVNSKGSLIGNAGAQGVKLKADDVTQRGIVYFDVDRGWMADQNLEQTMKGTAVVTTPNGQEVTMKFEQKMKIAIKVTPGK